MAERLLLRLLSDVEQLDPSACGAFVVESYGSHVGTVFVERSAVCWAAATGHGRRLRDLLREHLSGTFTSDQLEEYLRRKAEGAPVISHSMVTADAMRAALKQHTIESLISLPDRQGETVSWVPHRQQSYSPRFTFSPLELLVGSNAHLYRLEAEAAERGACPIDLDTPTATYVIGDEDEPIAVRAGGRHPSMQAVVELGTWAQAALGACRGFSPQLMQKVLDTASGEMSVAWHSARRAIHAAVIDDLEQLRRCVGELDRRGYPALVSKRSSDPFRLGRRDGLGAADHNM